MIRYLWKCDQTGQIVEHDHPSQPPQDALHTFKRVFSFGVGAVNGAGEAPSRPAP